MENTSEPIPDFDKLREAARKLADGKDRAKVSRAVELLGILDELQIHGPQPENRNEQYRAAREHLEANTRWYLDLIRSTPMARLTVTRKGLIRSANRAAAELLRVRADRLRGRPVSAFIHMEDHLVYFNMIKEIIYQEGTGKKSSRELRLMRVETVPFQAFVEVSAAYNGGGRFTGWDLSFLDITWIKRAESALRRDKNRYLNLLDSSGEALITVDPETGFILDTNAHAWLMYGYSRQEMLGFTRRHLSANSGCETQVSHPGLPATRLAYHKRKNGRVFPVEITETFRFLNGKKVVLLTVCDISRLSRYEKALNTAYAELETSEAQLKRTSARLLNIQEAERKKIARELHDSVGQVLAALKFNIENAISSAPHEGPEKVFEMLEGLVPVVQGAINEARAIYTGLRPSLLDDFGIVTTLHWFCREARKNYTIPEIECSAEIVEEDIPEEIKITIFRIVQEAMNNIAKHSKAGRAGFYINGCDDAIELAIEDDGVGFDTGTVLPSIDSGHFGMGLASMRERAELSGAQFAIESSQGKGTRITVRWKLPPPGGTGLSGN
jgi:PAS domain S-box-containing protein